MFEFIKKMFKREETKRIPGVTYAEVSRVPIERLEIKKFEPKKFNPKKVEFLKDNPWRSGRIMRMRRKYTVSIGL